MLRTTIFLLIFARVTLSDAASSSGYRSNRDLDTSSFSGYSVPPYVLTTMGGIQLEKEELLRSGSVYVPPVLRQRFVRMGPGWIYYGSMDEYAICRGRVNATNATGHPAWLDYFMCPSDITGGFNYQVKYCCGPMQHQHCCDKAGFFTQYGVLLSGTSTVVIVVACLLSSLGTCVCCCFSVCCLASLGKVKKPEVDAACKTAGAGGELPPELPLQTRPSDPPTGGQPADCGASSEGQQAPLVSPPAYHDCV